MKTSTKESYVEIVGADAVEQRVDIVLATLHDGEAASTL
jgi:hypothetical protein